MCPLWKHIARVWKYFLIGVIVISFFKKNHVFHNDTRQGAKWNYQPYKTTCLVTFKTVNHIDKSSLWFEIWPQDLSVYWNLSLCVVISSFEINCLFKRNSKIYACQMDIVKFLIILCSWARWFQPLLLASALMRIAQKTVKVHCFVHLGIKGEKCV